LNGRKMAELCSNKTYAFTVYPNTEIETVQPYTVQTRDRVQCMDRCLSEESFKCRSAVYTSDGKCRLLRYRGTQMKSVQGSYYMENDCIYGISRCEGFTQYVKEENVNLVQTKNMARISDAKLDDCVRLCRDDIGSLSFSCKSFEYNPGTRQCLLSEDNSLNADRTFGPSPSNTLYELFCAEGAKPEQAKTQGVSYLYGRENKYYEEEVPFQRFRNKILQSDFTKTYNQIELGRCLDECLHSPSRSCLSVMYSTRSRECRLSLYNQRNSRILYDPFFDYYENIIGDNRGSSNGRDPGGYYPGGGFRPSATNRPYVYGGGSRNSGGSRNTGRNTFSSRPRSGRCDPNTGDTFRQVRSRLRLRKQFIRKQETVNSLFECEQECKRELSFKCLSFNYMTRGYRVNCELSDKHERDLDEYDYESDLDWDYYGRIGEGGCLDVSQTCDQSGMEFTLRTPEGFRGRIYSHNNYGRTGCYVRGTGGLTYTLRIPSVGSYPDCGTTQYGDTMTNIVVVQFSESIQTSLDMKYNLTCTTRGPGSAVVTSGYIGAGSGQPVPIEYLPAEHTLDSRVRLVIKYQDRPTTTIAVGDPLQFKLETQEGENLLRDIFATNVIAKDPYSDRVVELIDSRGCPIDPYVFPALGLSRSSDGLETSFNAFKIPESNFLVFEATVRSCRSGCRPAVCDGPSGRDNSFGRKKRDLNQSDNSTKEMEVKEMFRVYETRANIPEGARDFQIIQEKRDVEVCLSSASYSGMLGGLVTIILLLLLSSVTAIVFFRKNRLMDMKYSSSQDSTISDIHLVKKDKAHGYGGGVGGVVPQERYLPPWKGERKENPPARWQDPSEPIYTDPTLFEKL